MSWMEKLYQTYEEGIGLRLASRTLPMSTSHTLKLRILRL